VQVFVRLTSLVLAINNWYKFLYLSKIYVSHFQVFLGHTGARDIEGNELPRLVYVSREKRPGYQHHKKAGAENALVCIDSSLIFRIRSLRFYNA